MKTVGKNRIISYSLTNPQACKTNQKNYPFYQVLSIEKVRFANPENDDSETLQNRGFKGAER